jgi:hypothetical protein
MMSRQAVDHLFHHILDGFKTSHEGILNLEREQLVSDEEIRELIEKNCDRLIDRVREFRVTEKILAVGFACMFGWLQISGEDLEMRRAKRMRARRKTEEISTTA